MEKNYKNLTKILFFITNLIFYKTSLGSPTSDKGFYILIIAIILTCRLDYFLLKLYPKKNYKFTVTGLNIFFKIGLSIYFREFHSLISLADLDLQEKLAASFQLSLRTFLLPMSS